MEDKEIERCRQHIHNWLLEHRYDHELMRYCVAILPQCLGENGLEKMKTNASAILEAHVRGKGKDFVNALARVEVDEHPIGAAMVPKWLHLVAENYCREVCNGIDWIKEAMLLVDMEEIIHIRKAF